MKNCREFLRCKECLETDKSTCERINKNRQKFEENRINLEQVRAIKERNEKFNILGLPKINLISERVIDRER